MHKRLPNANLMAFAAFFGLVSSIGWYLLTGHIGFDLADEGYLWYGAQRMALGEFPIRDFQAYDPGRYAYVAAFYHIAGNSGLLVTRVAAYSMIAILVMMMVFIVLSDIRREGPNAHPVWYWLLAATSAVIAVLWIFPYYKVFDHLASVATIFALFMLFRQRSTTAWLCMGLMAGFVSVIGRNHGLYAFFSSVVAALCLTLDGRGRRPGRDDAIAWLIGAVLGMTPIWIAALIVDGFFSAFIESIADLFRIGKTNLDLPVPWPWKVDYERAGVVHTLRLTALGVGFMLLIAFPAVGLVVVASRKFWRSGSMAFPAAVCAAIPYAHYAFSRADEVHLSLAIYPSLIGLLTAPFTQRLAVRVASAVALIVFSVFALWSSPAVAYLFMSDARFEKISVAGTSLLARPNEAAYLRSAVSAIESCPGARLSFFATPNMPGLHAAYATRIPTHSTYIGYPATSHYEQQEIQKVAAARPAMIILSNHALDGREDRRFQSLRPELYRWIRTNYNVYRMPGDFQHADTMEIYTRGPAEATCGNR